MKLPWSTKPEEEVARIAPLVSNVLSALGRSLRPGLRTKELEAKAVALLADHGLAPKMLGFRGFPSAIAVSVDDEVLHAPTSERELETGQLVKIQIGGRTPKGGADQGWTFGLGEVSADRRALLLVGARALKEALGVVRAGARAGDLGACIQGVLEGEGLSSIRDYVGYAIGERPMQDPQLPCYGTRGRGPRFEVGMVLHVHVIAAAGGYEVSTRPDGWTPVTVDGRPSSLHTAVVRVREQGCDVLTPLLS